MKIWHEPIPPIIFTKLKDACIERRKEEDWNYNDKLVGALNQYIHINLQTRKELPLREICSGTLLNKTAAILP